ncbi:MAG: methionyl-tRNA formyltransferase [Oscillospiraceae bacterium]|nr:methionyl-tRNA formyltransferase [Oscillospiraceae bacterium]
MKTKVFFMGTPDFAAESLKALVEDDEIEVVGAFTQPDKPVGRKQILEAPPVKKLCLEKNIPVWQPKKLRDGAALEIIKECAPDLIAVVAYGRILPDDILAYPRLGSINIHGSLLPKYRGAAPIQWAVINGERETGVTAMFMASELDAGDMIAEKRTQILPGETAGELFERLAPIGAELLTETIHALAAGTASRVPQDHAAATFAPPLDKEQAVIDFSEPAHSVVSKVLGLNPWPVAEFELNGQRIKAYRAEVSAESAAAPAVTKKGLLMPAGEGTVLFTEIQAPGGKRMKAADYFRGHPLC